MKTKGIALIMVLTTSGLLLLLLSAFINLNRDQFALTNSDFSHEAAVSAAQSAFEYCSYRLEQNRTWGLTPFKNIDSDARTPDPFVDPNLVIQFHYGTRSLEGTVPGTLATFTVDVINNIDGAAPMGDVPPGFCRLDIAASRSNSSVHRQAVLATSPLYDSAAIGSDGINIDVTGALTLASNDPQRNRIRSRKAISLPPESKISFVPPPGYSEKGVVWAGGEITSGSSNLNNATFAAEIAQNTGGTFYPKAQTHLDVHDLQIGEIDTNTTKPAVNLDSGVYVFDWAPITYQVQKGGNTETETGWVPILEHRKWVDKGGNGGDPVEYWVEKSRLPQNATGQVSGLPGSGATGHTVDAATFDLQPGVTCTLPQDDGPSISGGTKTIGALTINSDVNLQINGDFGVAAGSDSILPQVVFASGANGSIGHASVQCDGQLIISGDILGGGKLLAKGDVTVTPSYSTLQGDVNSGLAVYSAGNVTVKPPTANKTGNFGIGNAYFSGLIYAGNNIEYDAGGTALFVQGAMVARNGSLNIHDATDVNLRYDPSYLKSIVKKLPSNRIRLERALWKEL